LARWLLAMNLWTAALLAGALLLDVALARRARASWRIALYLPIALRLALPLSWTLSLRHAPQVVTLLTPRPDGFLPPPVGPAPAFAFPWQAALLLAYVAIAAVVVVLRVRAWLRLRRAIAVGAVPVVLPITGLPCPVLEHPHLGPLVAGLLRPRIVVPSQLLAPEEAHALACVLSHESAHVRRRDAWLAALLQVVTVVAWAVLPVWVAARRVRALVEMACDEEALDHADASARARYGRTLLDMAEWRTVTLSPFGAGELHFGSSLRARIRALANVRRWPRLVQAALVALAVGAFAACSSVGPGSPATSGADTTGAGWTAPTRALRTEADLQTYCAPFVEYQRFHLNVGGPRFRDASHEGLPAAQVAYCTSPALRDLIEARYWATEARNALGQIGKDMATEYVKAGYPMGRYSICGSGSPVPRVRQRAGEKYQTTCDKEWTDGAGWSCLHFCMDAPFYFQYELVSDGQSFKAIAH
ncbi:MAG TPA: M56 family metallopeptidase, partial [Polyangiaceae bacterium]